MAKLKLELTDLHVDSFDPTPQDGRRRGTVIGRGTDSEWGLCSGDSCQVFCSYNDPSCYGSCDTVCIDCHTDGCGGSYEDPSCAWTCAATCGDSCDCTVADTCPCI